MTLPPLSETYRSARVLVTGAGGFIGRVLVRRLTEEGAEVTPAGRRDACLSDRKAVLQLVQRSRPQIVFHLAGSTDRSPELSALAALLEVNLGGTVHLLEALQQCPPSAMLHTGSLDEYGDGPTPFREEQAPRALTPYAVSKLAAGAAWVLAGGTHVRLGLVYGAGQSQQFFLPSLVQAAERGETFPMTAGEQVRDFIHVEDVVEGLMQAAAAPALKGQVVNLCGGAGGSLKDVVATLQKVLARPFAVAYGALPYRSTEVFCTVGSPEKLRQATGWSPTVSLEDGLRKLTRNGIR